MKITYRRNKHIQTIYVRGLDKVIEVKELLNRLRYDIISIGY